MPARVHAEPAPPSDETTFRLLELISPLPNKRIEAIEFLKERGKKDAIAPLIQALRFARSNKAEILAALRGLAGEDAGSAWADWMLWQQAHPEIIPHKGYGLLKAALMGTIDPFFLGFLPPGVAHEIRLEEIVWGGVVKDGIPALTNPKHIPAAEANYLTDKELVFGVAINGDARAYPLRILDWHEMFNDVVGGIPVSLAYCTLCSSGILFETRVERFKEPLVFGSSGFLYRSNKLMYDTRTNSLWNQFTGRPVVGSLTGSKIVLKTRPVVITSWAEWKAGNPDTKVLSKQTGFKRDYTPGKPYGSYFASPNLMFPALVDESKLKAKDYVFALRGGGTDKAWPLALFAKRPVINDSAGIVSLTLVGNVKTRSVRAYRTMGETFKTAEKADRLDLDGAVWKITEDALIGPKSQKYSRLPGHIAYWFAWSGYFGADGELAQDVK